MIFLSELTHFNSQGRAKMVDVSEKNDTVRISRAKSSIIINEAIYHQIKNGRNKNCHRTHNATS